MKEERRKTRRLFFPLSSFIVFGFETFLVDPTLRAKDSFLP